MKVIEQRTTNYSFHKITVCHVVTIFIPKIYDKNLWYQQEGDIYICIYIYRTHVCINVFYIIIRYNIYKYFEIYILYEKNG